MPDDSLLSHCEDDRIVGEGLELLRAFLAIPERRHRDAVVTLAVALGSTATETVRDRLDAQKTGERRDLR